MRLHCALRNIEGTCNLLVVQALGDERDDLVLPHGKTVVNRGHRLARAFGMLATLIQQCAEQPPRPPDLAGHHVVERLAYPRCGRPGGQITANTQPK